MRCLNEDEQEEDLRRTMKYPDENKIRFPSNRMSTYRKAFYI